MILYSIFKKIFIVFFLGILFFSYLVCKSQWQSFSLNCPFGNKSGNCSHIPCTSYLRKKNEENFFILCNQAWSNWCYIVQCFTSSSSCSQLFCCFFSSQPLCTMIWKKYYYDVSSCSNFESKTSESGRCVRKR